MKTEDELTLAAIDKAYQDQVAKLFAVLGAANDADTTSGLAGQRFGAGLQRALRARFTAVQAAVAVIEAE